MINYKTITGNGASLLLPGYSSWASFNKRYTVV